MVGRTARHQSQPRPSRPQKSPSIDSWDHGGGGTGIPANGDCAPYGYDRRAKSSMRYQSNGRGPSVAADSNINRARIRGSASDLVAQQHQLQRGYPNMSSNDLHQRPSEHNQSGHRPLAITAGNLRGTQQQQEDPVVVAQQILDLRERRESSGKRKESSSYNRSSGGNQQQESAPTQRAIPQSVSMPISAGSGPSSPRGMVLKPVGSSITQEEIQAERRLKQAENKISGLLQELEELKFFQEIEAQQPAPTTPRTPRTPSKLSNNGNCPPITIRAPSPVRGGRLPPPPPLNHANTKPNASNDGGGLETYTPLSPRSIAKLDRNSLELECQTLVRKLQILEHERNSHAATIEMYEMSLQENDADKAKIHRLEGELKNVSLELKKQLQSIQKGKETLTKEYDERLQNCTKKLHRTQEKADAYKSDFEAAKANAERYRTEMEKHLASAAAEKARAEELLKKEENLHAQLQDARNLNATLVKKVEKKRSEVSVLKEDLTNTNKMMEENTKDREEMYESRIATLEQQLSISKDRYTRLEQECTERNAAIVLKDNELNEARNQQTEQEQKVEELYHQIEELEQQLEIKYEEGKKASKTMETRKVQEIVMERANAAREYERRIKAMQEQLRHQSDRHNAEIQETRKRNEKKLQDMKAELREEIRIKEGDKVNELEMQISKLQRDVEEERKNEMAKLHEAQQKAREASMELQTQNQLRQQELDQLHSRLNSYFNEIEVRDNQIADLRNQLETFQRIRSEMENTQKEQGEELEKCQRDLTKEREKVIEAECRLNDEILTMKSTYANLEESLSSEIRALREELDQGEKRLADAQAVLKEKEQVESRLEDLRESHDKTKQELFAERTRAEDIESESRMEMAKLHGKLRAMESSLESKKNRIEELEKQLDNATATSSMVGEEKQNKIVSLRKQLDDATKRLQIESAALSSKESELFEFDSENQKLREKLSYMSKLQENLREMERKLNEMESEKKEKRSELMESKSAYESMRAKVLEVEQRYSTLKEEFSSRLEKKEALLERYEKTIKDLEFDLQREKSDSSDSKRKMEELEAEKAKKHVELCALRKDYEDLTTLLEENFHSSAKKDELDYLLKKKDYEMRETVDIYNRQFSELETKHRDDILSKEMEIKQLSASLKRTEDEKAKLCSELADTKRKYQDVLAQLQDAKFEQNMSRGGIAADIDRKDQHMRQAVQRYTQTIAELESKLEEETQSKLELEDRLSSARSELENKQTQTQELAQRHTKEKLKLQSDISKIALERDQLKLDLDLIKKDLQKQKEELSFLERMSNQQEDYREFSSTSNGELHKKEMQIVELRKQIVELNVEVDRQVRESKDLKATCARYETELAQRKSQLSDNVSARSLSRSASRGLIDVDVSRNDSKIRDMTRMVSDLQSQLDSSRSQTESAKLKAESLSRELDEKESELRAIEVEKIEMETKLHTQARSKDELRSKVTELSSRLERKEREVREVSDRYKMYVMELESKLDQDTDAKHSLQLEIDRMRVNLNSACQVSSEAEELRQKVNSLESYKEMARDTEKKSKESIKTLEDELAAATKAKDLVEEALKKATAEKAEVISALEGVINEVQNREDEIESLSELLQRRDEELQHAKIIATKALQSAKDIQKRYKDKDQDRHADLMERMNEVSDDVDRLTTQNESLQLKIKSLERDLRDRNLECKRLKDQLRQIDGKPMRDTLKDDVSAVSTQSTYSMSHSGSMNGTRGGDFDGRVDPPVSLDYDSFSPSGSLRIGPTSFDVAFGADGFTGIEKQLSSCESFDESNNGSSTINSTEGNRWATDFDHHESASNSGDLNSSSKSRKSIERDALRKYVRKRYSKRGEKAAF